MKFDLKSQFQNMIHTLFDHKSFMIHKFKGSPHAKYIEQCLNFKLKDKNRNNNQLTDLNQLNILCENGLLKTHKFLDYGCGYLSGGIPIIEYLDPCSYTGADISKEVILLAHKRVVEQGLEFKKAKLLFLEEGRLNSLDEKYDVIWAHSVLENMSPSELKNFIRYQSILLNKNGCLFVTFITEESKNIFPKRKWIYDEIDLEKLSLDHNLRFEIIQPTRSAKQLKIKVAKFSLRKSD